MASIEKATNKWAHFRMKWILSWHPCHSSSSIWYRSITRVSHEICSKTGASRSARPHSALRNPSWILVRPTVQIFARPEHFQGSYSDGSRNPSGCFPALWWLLFVSKSHLPYSLKIIHRIWHSASQTSGKIERRFSNLACLVTLVTANFAFTLG